MFLRLQAQGRRLRKNPANGLFILFWLKAAGAVNKDAIQL